MEADSRKPTATSVKALLSAVLGVLALVLLAFACVPALLLGLSALREVNQSDGRLRGRGLAIAGMVLGGVGTVGCVVFLVALGLLHLREAGARTTCNNNLRRLGQVVNLYHDVHGHFPAGTVANAALPPEQRWSWHASLLVFLERDQPNDFKTPGLWKDASAAMHVHEPWNAEANRATVNTRLRNFVCPSYLERPEEGTPGVTDLCRRRRHRRRRVAAAARQPGCRRLRLRPLRVSCSDCSGGISNTIMAMETSSDGRPCRGGPLTLRGSCPRTRALIGIGRAFGGPPSWRRQCSHGRWQRRFSQ